MGAGGIQENQRGGAGVSARGMRKSVKTELICTNFAPPAPPAPQGAFDQPAPIPEPIEDPA